MYGRLVAEAVRYRYATLALVLVAAATAGAVATQMKFIFMDDSDAVEFSIEIQGSASQLPARHVAARAAGRAHPPRVSGDGDREHDELDRADDRPPWLRA